MTASPSSLRPLLIALVGVALASQSGCVWMRTKFARTAVYEDSPQVEPLEVPPGLDVPLSTTAVVIPNVTPNPNTQGASASASGAGAVPAVSIANGFTLADNLESTYRRVGLALPKISGVTMGDSAQVLHTHTVTYQGTQMLIRVEAAGNFARVFAVDGNGAPLTSDAAAALLTALKARLG